MEKIIDGATAALVEAELTLERIPSLNWKWAAVDAIFIASIALIYR